MEINCSHQKLVPIEQLIAHPSNANKHSKRQVEMLAKIMKYQGWRHPIVVSKLSGFIVAGHGRLAAAKLNGWTECPVDTQDFEDKTQEIAFLYSDNKIAELAEHDDELMKLGALELKLDASSFDFEFLGISKFEVDLPVEEKPKKAKVPKIIDCPECGHKWANE
jgi:ParB-like chromosome segregation protein Spo0J